MQTLKKNMLKIKNLTMLGLLIILLFTSCEEVVQLDLNTGEAKIVIDAEIQWKKGTNGNSQIIKISKMAPYYNGTTPKVSGAEVRVENSNGDVFTFNESEPGSYISTNFIPVIDMEYTLYVKVEEQSFTAVEKLTSVTSINRVEQTLMPDITGPDLIVLTYYFNDPVDQENYYLMDYTGDFLRYPEFTLTDDESTNGNIMSTSFADGDMKPGKKVVIVHRGISKQFYNYMSLILRASEGNSSSTPPSNIRGNIINSNDPKKFALGYFRLCESDSVFYEVK
ncbi:MULTISPECIES: DUF4249 family protein [Flavobacterium]|uniref:DUF4249 family protein n=1 Tax=Flavobacterium TaxID=237 RepID=UPI001181EEB2|nr:MULTISPECIES: DUF4249 family protein [Flavobacterium]MCR4033847.1 DUF4249 domain-containing protein [Flavobacterium panacis]